ncbi:hypothetical protein [Herpetosiphon sp. NSE202]|uniref:hypothetical protein n=1 Tax=Herpetosiphon sp. NSE202 TaxID=3351349 RepID=UPI00363EF2AA
MKITTHQELIGWHRYLEALGPRLTGSEAHQRFIEFLAAELTALGCEVQRDRYYFTRWEAQKWGLALQNANRSETAITTSFYYPYSGCTPAEGILGELVDCGKSPGNFQQAAGKIALVEVAVPALPTMLFIHPTKAAQASTTQLPKTLRNPTLGSFLGGPDLQAAKKAGVKGVICMWSKISSANAEDQYLPFTTNYQECPALWIDHSTGQQLKQAAAQGQQIRFTLEATLTEQSPTESLYVVLPSQTSNESILINTHTDGPNAPEENGALGLLALVRWFKNQSLERNLIFIFATGHFQLPQLGKHGQATSTWLAEHPALWNGQQFRAVAGVTLEHLGCSEWHDNRAFTSYQPTTQPEIELTYTTSPMLEQLYYTALLQRTKQRVLTILPINNIYFGEGEPFYKANIPTISLIPAPNYLCATPSNAAIDKLDFDLMQQQIETFARVIGLIDQTSSSRLGVAEPQPFSLVGSLFRRMVGANQGH